jgi:GT2 family glycosyltransferase
MKTYRQKKKVKILLGTPHNIVKDYCFEDWIERATNLSYPNYDILIADNSPTNKNKKRLMKRGIDAIYIKPKQKANQKFIAESHEALRIQALKHGYEFMLHLESDVFPPQNVIEQLLAAQKSVVSAPYFINHGENSHLMLQDIEAIGTKIRNTMNMDNGIDFNFVDGKVKQVYACGLGCTLIHRSILEKIRFRWEEGAFAHPDSFFAADLHNMGIKQYVDTSIICEHRNSSWSKITNTFKM